MAFGKDPNDAAGVNKFRVSGSFQQRSAMLQDARKEEFFAGKGGGGRRFSDQYRLPTDDYDIIRLVPGDFTYTGGRKDGTTYEIQLEYWPYHQHYFAKSATEGRSIICSGGPFYFIDGKGEPCLGEIEMKKGASNVSKSERYGFSLIHFAPYHKVQSLDDKGVVRKSDKTGEAYYDWERCRGRNKCEYCGKAEETRPFHRLHWSMPSMHYQTLANEYDYLIGKSCVNCHNKDCIDWEAWVCASCGEAVFEHATTSIEEAEIRKITRRPVRCPTCNNEGPLDEIVQCRHCGDPRRANMFDVDLHVKGLATTKKNQTQLIISTWSEPRPLDPAVPDEIRKPMNLPQVYRPDPVDKQAKFVGIKLEEGQAMSQETKAYGGENPNYGK